MSDRVKVLYFFPLVLVLFSSLVYYPSFAGLTSWDIGSGFGFYSSDNAGRIDFASSATVTQVQPSSGYVYFTNLFLTDYSWSLLGFNCSENANMTLSTIKQRQIIYTVEAGTGVTSTTKIIFPSANDVTVKTVEGSNTWSYGSNTLSVDVTHSSSQLVTITLDSDLDKNTDEVRSAWGNMFTIITLIIVFAQVSRVFSGNAGDSVLTETVGLVIITAALFLLLRFVDVLT